jgi:4-amino-4-deoxy-L-arabinose transferase-like glycosyltransferase
MRALSSARAFWALWLAVFALKIVLAITLPLFGDEAWYWLESRHPDWAYSDLPGMTAWLIGLGVGLAGHSSLGVRWPFVAMAMLVPLLLRRSAARIGTSAGDADRVGMLALLLPLLGALGPLALPDVPLTLAAALCLDASLRLRERRDRGALIGLALGLALGASSHYRFAPLMLAGAVGWLLDPGCRARLRDPWLWVAVLAGCTAWIPLMMWNAAHASAGLAFQFADRHPWQWHGEGWRLWLAQAVVLSPLLMVALVAGLLQVWRAWRARQAGPWGLLLGSAALPLLAYGLLAFFADRERVSFHWMLQAWLPLLLVVPSVLARWSPAWRRLTWGVAAAGLLLVTGHAGVAGAPTWRAALADSMWYPDNFTGWTEIGEVVRRRIAAGAEPALVADNFMLGAQLAFAFGVPGVPTLDHPLNHKHGRALQLRLWGLEASLGRRGTPRWLIVEDSATPLRQRLRYYQALCDRDGGLASPESLAIDHGRKRFLIFDRQAAPVGECRLPALSWIDAPAADESVAGTFEVRGWAFKDGAGIERVEILLDGVAVAQADYGRPAPHVAPFWETSRDPAHPHVGFAATLEASNLTPGTHWLGLRLHGRDGSVETSMEQRLRIAPRPVDRD